MIKLFLSFFTLIMVNNTCQASAFPEYGQDAISNHLVIGSSQELKEYSGLGFKYSSYKNRDQHSIADWIVRSTFARELNPPKSVTKTYNSLRGKVRHILFLFSKEALLDPKFQDENPELIQIVYALLSSGWKFEYHPKSWAFRLHLETPRSSLANKFPSFNHFRFKQIIEQDRLEPNQFQVIEKRAHNSLEKDSTDVKFTQSGKASWDSAITIWKSRTKQRQKPNRDWRSRKSVDEKSADEKSADVDPRSWRRAP